MNKNNKGFTLIETMMYVTLFGILMSGAVLGTYNLLEGGNRNITATRIQEEGTFINRKISWSLSGATLASISASGDTITISRPDLGAQDPLIISGVGGVMGITRGTSPAVQLNSDRFVINNVKFVYQPEVNDRPPSVSVSYMVDNKSFNFRSYLRH